MLFNSLQFLLFFPVVTLLYFLFPQRYRWLLLLTASCVFYCAFYPPYILILFFTIAVDYVAGIYIEKSEGARRKQFLIMSIIANVGVLAIFKYFNFFLNNLNHLLHGLYIEGHDLGFWKIMLRVTPDVLTPRPDTETILDVVLPAFEEAQRFSVLDLGVGSGALLLAILAERPGARGLGVDVSEEALAVARENAANLGLASRAALLRSDWTAGLDEASFDLVVSNPPYIASADIADLAPEVRDHEPRLALDGGADGLDAFRVLAPQILRVLKDGGLFAVEIGADQSAAVEKLFTQAGALEVKTVKDLAARDRVVTGRKKALG